MKRYRIKVRKTKTMIFDLNADNKKTAKNLVDEIIYNTHILNSHYVNSTIKYDYKVRRKG